MNFRAAARMESNGEPGRIHVSEATAMELKKYGYEGWLERRDETIHAKGKGTMQTYFIVGAASRSTASGYSAGDGSYSWTGTNDDTTTRRLHGEGREDILMADKGFEDDEFMLDLHEKLQHRLAQKGTTNAAGEQGDDSTEEQIPTHRVRSIADSDMAKAER